MGVLVISTTVPIWIFLWILNIFKASIYIHPENTSIRIASYFDENKSSFIDVFVSQALFSLGFFISICKMNYTNCDFTRFL